MKYIFVPLLSLICCFYALSGKAQQLIAPAGGESSMATWAIGEVISGYYQTDEFSVVQGVLSYMDLVSPVGIESDEWQEKIAVWPSPVIDNLNISIPQSPSFSPVHICFYSLTGALVKQISLLKSSSTYNVSSFAPGIYNIRFTDANGKTIAIKKIIKL